MGSLFYPETKFTLLMNMIIWCNIYQINHLFYIYTPISPVGKYNPTADYHTQGGQCEFFHCGKIAEFKRQAQNNIDVKKLVYFVIRVNYTSIIKKTDTLFVKTHRLYLWKLQKCLHPFSFYQGSTGKRQWPINQCRSSMIIHKITPSKFKKSP